MFDFGQQTLSTAAGLQAPGATELPVIHPAAHYLDFDFVVEGNDETKPGRKLAVERWNNTTHSIIRAARLSDEEELYILARSLGGFIWVPRTNKPAFSTILQAVVGRAGGYTIYANAVDRAQKHNPNSARYEAGPARGKGEEAEPYELWAVNAELHALRAIAPEQSVGRAVHELFVD